MNTEKLLQKQGLTKFWKSRTGRSPDQSVRESLLWRTNRLLQAFRCGYFLFFFKYNFASFWISGVVSWDFGNEYLQAATAQLQFNFWWIKSDKKGFFTWIQLFKRAKAFRQVCLSVRSSESEGFLPLTLSVNRVSSRLDLVKTYIREKNRGESGVIFEWKQWSIMVNLVEIGCNFINYQERSN